jgi:hypothetical protein
MRRSVHASLRDFLSLGPAKDRPLVWRARVVEVAFDDEADAFLNINTLDELTGWSAADDAAPAAAAPAAAALRGGLVPVLPGLERIESFRARHDPMAARIPAHVSLVFPFGSVLTPLQLETHVRRIVSRWPPIPVTFRHVRMHANEFVFLMASRGAARSTALHDRLYTRSLRPHLRPSFRTSRISP